MVCHDARCFARERASLELVILASGRGSDVTSLVEAVEFGQVLGGQLWVVVGPPCHNVLLRRT
eukprot:3291784-Prymnesium_polylepis.1